MIWRFAHSTINPIVVQQGDGNIRYFEITTEKPYLQYLMEFRSPTPQKGLGKSPVLATAGGPPAAPVWLPFSPTTGVMPKHGLDVGACEVFRFYKLVTMKGLIEPISMIVPRRVSKGMTVISWFCSAVCRIFSIHL